MALLLLRPARAVLEPVRAHKRRENFEAVREGGEASLELLEATAFQYFVLGHPAEAPS